jgi:Copper type II ascorbate-dependent monooxygenase, C-terminal domain
MKGLFTRAMVLGGAVLIWAGIGANLSAASAPTFSKDVAPILYKNCATCHRPDEPAPMSLLTYKDARPWAKSIRQYVSSGLMPPWHATQPHGVFLNDRRLSEADKNTLISWVDAGAPEGNPSDLPPMPKFVDGWQIGKPDLVLTMSKPFHVPAKGTIDYQFFPVATHFTEDKWVQAMEIRPGVRSVVHHVIVYMKEPQGTPMVSGFKPVLPVMPARYRQNGGAEEKQQQQGPGVFLAGTAPGAPPMVFQPGKAIRIPAGSTLIFQMHYTANGKEAEDQTSLGLIFAKEPPEREIHASAFLNPLFTLPAGSSDTAVDSAIEFTEDSHITSLIPHTHLRGKSWEYRLIYPDGHSQVVLDVPHYDFNWQTWYTFAKPLAVPKGSRLEATAHYDNSVNNPSNPDPKVDVHWGDQTWNEMQFTGITYYVDHPTPTNATAQK